MTEKLYKRLAKPALIFTSGVVLSVGAMTLRDYYKKTPVVDSSVVLSTKLNKITVADAYSIMTEDQVDALSNELVYATVITLLEDKYGDKITADMVKADVDKTKVEYGDEYKSILASQNLTEEAYEKQVRNNLLVEYAYKTAAEHTITDSDYEAAFENYIPEMTLQVITVTSEDTAKTVKSELAKEGADFATIAETATELQQIEHVVSSANGQLPRSVMEAAFKQDVGAVSDIIADTTTIMPGYHIVKTIKKAEKPAKWQDIKDELKSIIVGEKVMDENFTIQIIGNWLKEYDIKINDPSVALALERYLK